MSPGWRLFVPFVFLAFPTIAEFLDDEGPNRGHSQSAKYISPAALQDDITTEGLRVHLLALQQIADSNGGHRAFGYHGDAATVSYIHSQISPSNFLSPTTSTTWTQAFTAPFYAVSSISLTANSMPMTVFGLAFSPSTPPGGITSLLILGPAGTAACSVGGYDGLEVKDKIVLVERGPCPAGGTLAGKVRPAKEAGAKAVLIYNDGPEHVTYGTLTVEDEDHFVPVGFLDRVDGWELSRKLGRGEEVLVSFQMTQFIGERESWNLLVDVGGADEAEGVIMLGAHLDSVLAGSGINDNGSGVSLLIELFSAVKKYKWKNKIRFAFWGGEESGFAGSTHYVENLDEDSARNILLYLNFDMIARGFYGVFSGAGAAFGSETIEKLFSNELQRMGKEVVSLKLNGGSDYTAFMEVLGKPVGGLHTGTGKEQDPCYHLVCDVVENIDWEVLTVNAKAAAHVLAVLAMEADSLIFKTELAPVTRYRGKNGNDNRTQAEARSSFLWSTTPGEGKHASHCGNFD